MYVLDTNVISEIMRLDPDPLVRGWVDQQAKNSLFCSVISEIELRFGIAILQESSRKENSNRLINRILDELFEGRVLPFNRRSVPHYVTFASSRKAKGRHVPLFDCQIAAIAKTYDMTLVSRDKEDFAGMDIDLINPWEG